MLLFYWMIHELSYSCSSFYFTFTISKCSIFCSPSPLHAGLLVRAAVFPGVPAVHLPRAGPRPDNGALRQHGRPQQERRGQRQQTHRGGAEHSQRQDSWHIRQAAFCKKKKKDYQIIGQCLSIDIKTNWRLRLFVCIIFYKEPQK